MTYLFETVARLPAPEDNVAIATRVLNAGTEIAYKGATLRLDTTVLVGHRFAVEVIPSGEALTSWGQPFGAALKRIEPGSYVCNEGVLRELARRSLDFTPPTQPNFTDLIAPFSFDEAAFEPAPPLPPYEKALTFEGYRRSGGRGVGTRNFIVLLGTSALTGGFVRALETQLKGLADQYPNVDGIVAAAHTEGGGEEPNNRDLLLRTLAGFVVNPNVGAVLLVDRGTEAITNAMLKAYMDEAGYPRDSVIHKFMSLSRSFNDDIARAATVVRGWLADVNAMQRTTEPASELKIGLQCGGSDAFSGVSGNPLAGWVAKQIVRCGGSANLAETDELIGAESYVLKKVRDIETARKFLRVVERFRTWTGWHGASAEGNPSGGNKLRGLYNIYLKSLGAAMKRDPDVRLDAVIEYGEPMREGGFYFMDSPGNDLESIAGQVASGCNLIFFVTGNGSITNFPYVPTIKIITTTERYHLLPDEMDVNAGAYLDGTPLETLGEAMLYQTLDAASGALTVGEKAGHAQVQIWRDWRQTGMVSVETIRLAERTFSREPLPIRAADHGYNAAIPAYRTGDGYTTDRVGLILPTSLCSGQIARMAADALNESGIGDMIGVARFVTLIHTEGCGSTTGRELDDTVFSYLTHPMVAHALLLEHGCEKTHNGYFRQILAAHDVEATRFGWASVQLDGGIQKVIVKMTDWFAAQPHGAPEQVLVGLEAARIGLVSHGAIAAIPLVGLAAAVRTLVSAGGTVVIPENDALLTNADFRRELGIEKAEATLGYAQQPQAPGFHVMEMPSRQWSETLTGLGATGIELIVAHVGDQPMAGHPLIPVLQITADADTAARYAGDIDLTISSEATAEVDLLSLISATLGKVYAPRLRASGNADFQITRGLMGVSL